MKGIHNLEHAQEPITFSGYGLLFRVKLYIYIYIYIYPFFFYTNTTIPLSCSSKTFLSQIYAGRLGSGLLCSTQLELGFLSIL